MSGIDTNQNGTSPARRPSPRAPRTPFGVLLDVFSSVWTGVALMAFLFVFMSIGSAGYLIRQMRWAEMTEYEWFHWWPFNLAIGLFCLTLILATVRRIRLNVVNLGVWMIHTGIIVLAVGSVIYFARKVEGDTPVFRRQVVIHSAKHEPLSLVAVPGARLTVGDGPDRVMYEVVEINPSWPLLTGEHAGERVYSVSVSVTTPERRFVRQLLDGFPQYTEDILPGAGRAVRTLGTRLVDDGLEMSLDYHTQEWFHLMDTWALFVRSAGEEEWTQRPIRRLPRYNDYVATREDVWPTFDNPPVRPHPIDVRVAAAEPNDPLADAQVRITGYLRYAVPETRLVPGGDALNPMLNMHIETDDGFGRAYELIAFDPAKSRAEQGELVFTWVDSQADVAPLLRAQERRLRVSAPALGVEIDEPIADPAALPDEPAFVEVEGTGFAYRVREVVDGLPMNDGAFVSIAVVDFRVGDEEFTRWVADEPSVTRDFIRPLDDDPMGEGHALRAPDERIDARYAPGRPTPRLRIVAGPPPVGLLALIGEADGDATPVPVRINERTSIGDGLSFTVSTYSPTARQQTKPRIVPPAQRDGNARTNYAMVKIEVTHGGRTESQWAIYNHYAFPDSSFVYGGRFRFAPVVFRLADGREVEMLFSRKRKRLPEPMVLEDFHLVTHVGGFTGSVTSIRDWESTLRFVRPGEDGLSGPMYIRTNAPGQHAGLRYFQSMWDPPDPPRFEGDIGTAGLNFTGVGVGNREGVVTQLAGCVIAVVGMLYAFYVKPIIKRRRRERVLSELDAEPRGANHDAAPNAARTPEFAGAEATS